MAKAKFKVGDLVAREEAPTVVFRVTSTHGEYVRILPFRRSGKEHILLAFGSGWIGDGSKWNKT